MGIHFLRGIETLLGCLTFHVFWVGFLFYPPNLQIFGTGKLDPGNRPGPSMFAWALHMGSSRGLQKAPPCAGLSEQLGGGGETPRQNLCFACGFAAHSPGQCWEPALALLTATLATRRAPGFLLADCFQLVG